MTNISNPQSTFKPISFNEKCYSEIGLTIDQHSKLQLDKKYLLLAPVLSNTKFLPIEQHINVYRISHLLAQPAVDDQDVSQIINIGFLWFR